MKKTTKTILILLSAVFCLVAAGCGKEKEVRVSGVSVSPVIMTLREGETGKLTATVSPSDAENKEVNWRSSAADVARVSGDGTVTALKAGEATITATTVDGGKSASCKVTVEAKLIPVTGISLDRSELALRVGEETILKAIISPADATDKSVVWTSSEKGVATVDSDGRITAIKAGKTTVTATAQGGFSTSCDVTVTIPVTSVTLDKTSITLTVGENLTLVATVRPDDATDKSVSWVSSDPDVAVVDAAGKVVAVKRGATDITVTTVDGGLTATCKVSVTEKSIAVTGVRLNKTTLELVAGSEETLTATVIPDNAVNKNVAWKSSVPEVAAVDNNGKVSAKKEGEAIITVTTEDGGKEANCLVTVSAASVPVNAVILDRTAITLTEGENATLVATISPLTATNKNVKWTSDKPDIATVDANGKVTAEKEGTATITVTTEDGGKTASCTVTVNKMVIHVTGVTVSPTTLSIAITESPMKITATVTPSNATNKTIVWSSSDPAIASVDTEGNVKGLKAGTVTITATSEDDSEKKATCTVNVGNYNLTSSFDAKFAKVLQEKGYVADAARILDTEVSGIASLDVAGRYGAPGSLTSLKGIEYFTNLEKLKADYNALTSIDVSMNTALTYLHLGDNKLTSIDVSHNTALTYLVVNNNALTSIDVSKNTALTHLNVRVTKLKSIDISRNTALTYLDVGHNSITGIDLSANTKLTYLYVGGNSSLKSLDLSKNTVLESLNVSNITGLGTLDLGNNQALTSLNAYASSLSDLNISKNTALTYLDVNNNSLVSLDISANTKLVTFNCTGNLGNADNIFVVTVWSGFTATAKYTAQGSTWNKYGKTITLEYKEKQ